MPFEKWQLGTQILHTVVAMGIKGPLLLYLPLFSIDAGMFQFCLLNLQKINKVRKKKKVLLTMK